MLGLIKVQNPLSYARTNKSTKSLRDMLGLIKVQNPLRYARTNKSKNPLEIC
jgi:hypothetical protein